MIFEPLKIPDVKFIENSKKEFENIVCGEYDYQGLDKNTLLICNKNGKDRELVPNRRVGIDTICGNFFIASDAGDGKYASLSNAQIQYYFNQLHKAEVISQKEVKEDIAMGFDRIGKETVYINNLNMRLIEENIDLEKVIASYKTEDKTEAKILLKSMLEAFKDTYSVTNVDEISDKGEEIAYLPVVIKGRESGELCIGIVMVDLQSSGEMHSAQYLIHNGFYEEDDVMSKKVKMIREKIGIYDYWYPLDYTGDIHVNFENVPDDVQKILDYAKGIDEHEQGINMDSI